MKFNVGVLLSLSVLCEGHYFSNLATPFAEWRQQRHLGPIDHTIKESKLCEMLHKEARAEVDPLRTTGKREKTFLQTAPTAIEERPLPYDGYFNQDCKVDMSPEEHRVYYKEEMEKEHKETEPMNAEVCFSFCRDRPEMRFFVLSLGRECYCATYVHLTAGSGLGACTRQCEGNSAQFCGGDHKSSIYEMHRCSDGLEVAEKQVEAARAVRTYTLNLVRNATFILNGMDQTADNLDIAEVRHNIQAMARALNKLLMDANNAREQCVEDEDVLSGLIPKTVPSSKTDLEALEQATEKLKASCDDRNSVLNDANNKLVEYLDEHDIEKVLARSGTNIDEVIKDGAASTIDTSFNRMTEVARRNIGCDDTPWNGCDGFELMYWPHGDDLAWFAKFYVPAEYSEPLTAEEFFIAFGNLCHKACQVVEGCSGGDVFGNIDSSKPTWEANCALKGHIDQISMAKYKGGLGYTMDTGFILESYFQVAQDDIAFTIDDPKSMQSK